MRCEGIYSATKDTCENIFNDLLARIYGGDMEKMKSSMQGLLLSHGDGYSTGPFARCARCMLSSLERAAALDG